MIHAKMSNSREFILIIPKIHVIGCVSWELVPKPQKTPFPAFFVIASFCGPVLKLCLVRAKVVLVYILPRKFIPYHPKDWCVGR
jgi:hypothetical protein